MAKIMKVSSEHKLMDSIQLQVNSLQISKFTAKDPDDVITEIFSACIDFYNEMIFQNHGFSIPVKKFYCRHCDQDRNQAAFHVKAVLGNHIQWICLHCRESNGIFEST